ncbi:manganese efflux pump MntP family protein [soil metagenome]
MWQAIALSLALAMDAAAVSAARALGAESHREVMILPIVFGGFQAGMAALGWLGGAAIGPYIAGWDAWVAFALLVAIGGKMLYDAVTSDDAEPPVKGTTMVYLGLGLATSIDAAAAGITLPLVPVPPWLSILLIGVITAGAAMLGHLAGRALAGTFGKKLGAVGGLVLIGLAVKMVIS